MAEQKKEEQKTSVNPALNIPPSLKGIKTQKGNCGQCNRSARIDGKK